MKFSILNLLLVLTTTASFIGLYASWSRNSKIVERYEADISEQDTEIAQLQAALKSLRQEAGFLTINDPTRIHAVKLRTTSRKTWSYRVYLPQGHSYYFATQINSLPSVDALPEVEAPPGPSTIKGLQGNSVTIGRDPGEYVVTLSINSIGENWNYRLNVRKSGNAGDGATGGSVISCAKGEWPHQLAFQAEGGVSNQINCSVDQECLLLDFRAMDESMKTSSDSKQGAILWIGLADNS